MTGRRLRVARTTCPLDRLAALDFSGVARCLPPRQLTSPMVKQAAPGCPLNCRYRGKAEDIGAVVAWPLTAKPERLIWAYADAPAGPTPPPRSGSMPGATEVVARTEFVLLNRNHAGSRLVDHVDLGDFDRLPLFLGRAFLRAHARTLNLGLRFFRLRVLCRILRPSLAPALPRFELFLRVATR